MTRNRRTLRALIALLALSGLLLAACGGGSSGSSSDDTANTGTGAATGGGDAADRDPNGVLKMAYNLLQTGGPPVTLDPTKEVGDTNDPLMYMVFGRILRPTPDGDLVPDQAESTSIADANTIKITLRPNQTFHDGTVFDAAAVKASLERTLASGNEAGLTPAFFALKTVTVDGPLDLTLAIADGKAASWHDTFLSGWQTTVIPPTSTVDKPVGAGPFEVTNWTKNVSMEMKAYPAYWDAASIKVAGVELTQNDQGQEASALSAVQAGQIDLAQIDVPQIDALGGNIELLKVADPSRLVNMQICKKDGPLANADVRVALNKAIDREAISDALYEGTAEPGTTLWPEGNRFYDPELADVLAYDPDAAKQMLADAGYADGFSFDMYVLPALGLPDVAAVYQQQLAEIGVTMKILPTPAIVNDWMATGKPGMGLIPLLTANEGKLTQWVGDTTGNVCDYDNPDLNALATKLQTVSIASDEAKQIWFDIQDIVVNDALSGLVVFGSRLAAYNSDVVGDPVLYPRGTFPVPDLRITYVKKSS